MKIAALFAKMKAYEKNGEVIFDDEEPVGKPTDVVMPRRRWFRRSAIARDMRFPLPQQPKHS